MVQALAAAGRVVPVARRDRVRLEGSELVAVLEGCFRLYRDAAFVRDVSLVLAGPGELLAAGALFGERSAESGAEALIDGRLAYVDIHAAERYLAERPIRYAELARRLARRTLAVQRKLEALSRASLEARVVGALLEIAQVAGSPLPGGAVRLELALSQADLAALAGTSRESASSIVAALGRAGLVRGRRLAGLVLTSPEALAERSAVDSGAR